MSSYPYHRRMANPRPRRRESDRLLHRIRDYVREAELLGTTQAGEAAVQARQREIEHLQQQLADAVKQDPTAGHEDWGRVRQGATHD